MPPSAKTQAKQYQFVIAEYFPFSVKILNTVSATGYATLQFSIIAFLYKRG